jgi:hypothetical protein
MTGRIDGGEVLFQRDPTAALLNELIKILAERGYLTNMDMQCLRTASMMG